MSRHVSRERAVWTMRSTSICFVHGWKNTAYENHRRHGCDNARRHPD